MATPRRQRFIYGQTAWMMTALVVLAVLNAVWLELFFVVSLIGFLLLSELTAPFQVTPRWRGRLRWVMVAGLAVFGVLLVRRVLEILPSGVI